MADEEDHGCEAKPEGGQPGDGQARANPEKGAVVGVGEELAHRTGRDEEDAGGRRGREGDEVGRPLGTGQRPEPGREGQSQKEGQENLCAREGHAELAHELFDVLVVAPVVPHDATDVAQAARSTRRGAGADNTSGILPRVPRGAVASLPASKGPRSSTGGGAEPRPGACRALGLDLTDPLGHELEPFGDRLQSARLLSN